MDVSSAFPRYAESDWRKAAEAAEKADLGFVNSVAEKLP